jgi:hypothetical protein
MPIEFTTQQITRNGQMQDILAAGNLLILEAPNWISFSSSRKVTGEQFLNDIQWAEDFKVETDTLITGHQSPVEKEVARIILNKGGHVIIGLARAPIKRLPAELVPAYGNQQITFITLPTWTNQRPTRSRCLERNEWIGKMGRVL